MEKISQNIEKILVGYINQYTKKSKPTKATDIISSSNPYRISEFDNDIDFIVSVTDKYLNKSWETIFGNILEQLQISLSGGIKSTERGMDIEYVDRDYFIGSKSGPNWANSDQRKSMERNACSLRLKTNKNIFVCCSYGKKDKIFESYTEIAGQKAWEHLTGDDEMYKKIGISLNTVNKKTLQKLKQTVVGDIKDSVIVFWKSNFYNEGTFDYNLYIEYVSAK
jgi:hypothetical protein